jgi:hypothetical protein
MHLSGGNRLVCKKKSCRSERSSIIKRVEEDNEWREFPSADEDGFGHGKFCYFISCPDSELPIRDYVHKGKSEPHYETRSYNECALCNQRGIRSTYSRGISYLIFYTRYKGTKNGYRNKYFITGLFPISTQKKVKNRIAYRSENPIFLSIEDSMRLGNELWQKWFGKVLPKDNKGSHNLRYMTKFVKKDSPALKDVLNHFDSKKSLNRIDDYTQEINMRTR